MATNDSSPKRGRRTVVLAVGAVLAAALAVVALGPLGVAGAQDSTPKAGSLTRRQEQCLAGQALTFLQHNTGASISLSLIQSVRDAVPKAAKACGVTLPSQSLAGALSQLGITLDQVQCVLSHGVTLPQVGEDQKPTPEALQALRNQLVAAAQSCGITVPAKVAGTSTI